MTVSSMEQIISVDGALAPALAKARFGHVAIVAKDPVAQAAFYRQLFSMHLVGDSPNGATAFLAHDPERESHDIAFVRDAALVHLAFKVDTLAELLQIYQGLKAAGVRMITQYHGISFAIYFYDPEDNAVEVYWPTGRVGFWLPFIRMVDLDQSEEQLLQMDAETPSNSVA